MKLLLVVRMNKERELLRKIVDYMWEGELVDEIKELLAQPEQPEQTEQEDIRDVWQDGYEAGLRLAKREPLSESRIAAIWGDSDYDVAVVRRIEKAHGIGE
jgi:hypothetical protein